MLAQEHNAQSVDSAFEDNYDELLRMLRGVAHWPADYVTIHDVLHTTYLRMRMKPSGASWVNRKEFLRHFITRAKFERISLYRRAINHTKQGTQRQTHPVDACDIAFFDDVLTKKGRFIVTSSPSEFCISVESILAQVEQINHRWGIVLRGRYGPTELTYRQIGEQMGISEGAVQSLHVRALDYIKNNIPLPADRSEVSAG
jgi:DNA-directed RNA polymerase specialized sigma24 family protein